MRLSQLCVFMLYISLKILPKCVALHQIVCAWKWVCYERCIIQLMSPGTTNIGSCNTINNKCTTYSQEHQTRQQTAVVSSRWHAAALPSDWLVQSPSAVVHLQSQLPCKARPATALAAIQQMKNLMSV